VGFRERKQGDPFIMIRASLVAYFENHFLDLNSKNCGSHYVDWQYVLYFW
jgi:hypothetical protein